MSKYVSFKLHALTNSIHVDIAAEELKRRKLLEARLAIEAAKAEKAKQAEAAGRRTFDHLMIKVVTLFYLYHTETFLSLFSLIHYFVVLNCSYGGTQSSQIT